MRILFFTIGFIFLNSSLFSQKSSWDRNDWIYWQKDKKLTYNDFKGKVGDCGTDIIDDSIHIESEGCMVIWSILDIPKTWKKGVEYERFYFAPVFNVSKSWAKSNDSIAILKTQVYFDLSELSARWARKELYRLREESGNATGTTAIMYSTIRERMLEMKHGIFVSYFNSVYRTNSIDSLQSWVDLTNKLLEESKEFETKEIEFERIMTGKSEKGYKKAKRIIGPMKQ